MEQILKVVVFFTKLVFVFGLETKFKISPPVVLVCLKEEQLGLTEETEVISGK